MDSSTHTAPVDLETVKQDSVTGLSEIVTKNVSRADAWIHQRTLPLFTQKESRKTESLPHIEIALESAFTGHEWIRLPTQHLLTHKQSRKTESLSTHK